MKLVKYIFISLLVLITSTYCGSKQNSVSNAYLNSSLSTKQRVNDLLSRMTLEEKVGQMCQFVGIEHMKTAEKHLTKEEMEKSDAHGFYENIHSSDIETMIKKGHIGSFLHVTKVEEANHLQKIAQESRLKIPLLIGIDAIHGTALVDGATVYPTPIGLASTWDTALVRKMSAQTASEMRASGSAWGFTPNIDIARDARWGRVGETFGEDPFLVSSMGSKMIEGLQYHPHPEMFKTIACAKHLIAGSQSVNGLNGAPTDLSERTIREVFLPPYQAVIDAGVFSVMTAHNELNGIPCHADKWMMTDILKKELGFDGFIVSDWMDIERLATKHFYAKNQKEACFQTVDAGMDMHMHGPDFLEPIVELVEEGRLSEERINQSVSKIIEAKIRLGLFENAITNTSASQKIIFNEEHQKTALEAAQKSMVLLKNDHHILPLPKKSKIFITGPNANNETILGDWSAQQPNDNTITILEGIKQQAPESQIDFLDIGSNVRNLDREYLVEAKTRAEEADYAVVVVGENSYRWEWNDKTCGENSARSDLGLVGIQQDFIQAVYESGTPTIVVLVNGRPLAVEWVANHIPALIESWEMGSKGGLALAQVLFGEVNPSGKLPITIPRSAGHQLAIYNHKPTHFMHKYVTSKTDPLFPFGFGLSYTSFNYQNLEVSKAKIKPNESFMVKIDVTNTGNIAGDEIVQLYINDKYASITRPIKELKGFKRISLNPRDTKTVTFEVTPDMLALLDKDFTKKVEPGEFKIMVGCSSASKDLVSIPILVQ